MLSSFPKATVDGIRIDAAYADLTRPVFALWIRMMAEPRASLEKAGVVALAARFGYRKSAFIDALHQLRNKGYIRVQHQQAVGEYSEIFIAKRPVLVAHDHFIKLS